MWELLQVMMWCAAALLSVAVVIVAFAQLVRLFVVTPKHLRWHCLTALIWTLVTGIQTLVMLNAPEERTFSAFVILLASGSVWFPSWLQFAARRRGDNPVQVRRPLLSRLYMQTLWGPLALCVAMMGFSAATQRLFESAVAHQDLSTAFLLRDAKLADNQTSALRDGLIDAVKRQDADAVSAYLAVDAIAYNYGNEENDYSLTPTIALAVQRENSRITELFLKHAASPDETIILRGGQKSLLHLAVESGNANQVRTLLRHGAKRVVYDQEGNTPFQIAKKRGNREIVALLLQPTKK